MDDIDLFIYNILIASCDSYRSRFTEVNKMNLKI